MQVSVVTLGFASCQPLSNTGVDRDEDGFTEGSGDCDDADPAVFPGAEETCGNQRIEDCRLDATTAAELCLGSTAIEDRGVALADAGWLPQFGTRVVPAGDLDADGTSDLVVTGLYCSAPWTSCGGVFNVYTRLAELAEREEIEAAGRYDVGIGPWLAAGGDDSAQIAAAGGPIGDDLVVVVFEPSGSSDQITVMVDEVATVQKRNFPEDGAVTVAWTGDLGGAAEADFAVAYWGTEGDGDAVAVVGVFEGPVHDTLTFGQSTQFYPPDARAVEVVLPANAGDLDGDGRTDLAIGMQGADEGVWVWYSASFELDGRELSMADADLVVRAAGAGMALAAEVDLDDDGRDDVVLGAPAAGSGAVVLVSGALGAGDFDVADAGVVLRGGHDGDQAGTAVAAGDFDGDGWVDVAVGGPGAEWAAEETGLVWMVYGPFPGDRELSTGVATHAGSLGAELGAALATLVDFDGDGDDELVVGAPGAGDVVSVNGQDGSVIRNGAAWILRGEPTY